MLDRSIGGSRWFELAVGGIVAFGGAWAIGALACWSTVERLTLGTGLVVLWYTVETNQMRREMVQQTALSVQPLLVAGIEQPSPPPERTGAWPDRLMVRNIGKGTALFVTIDPIDRDEPWLPSAFVRFEVIDYIEPGEKRPVSAMLCVKESDGTIQEVEDFTLLLKPGDGRRESFVITIRYEDVLRNARQSPRIRMGADGIRLLK